MCAITVDGIDCKIQEAWTYQRHVNSKLYSKKIKNAGYKYEIGVCIQTVDVVWVNVPLKAGSWVDIAVYIHDLKRKLRAGEMIE
jgi:hypothetical protein